MRWFLIFVLLTVLTGTTASAQSDEQLWDRCENQDKQHSSDLAIGGCTALIQSGSLTDENLAIAFYNRGLAYYHKGEYDRAIADYNQAIRTMHTPSTTAAVPTPTRASTTAPSPTLIRRSASIRDLHTPSTTAAVPTPTRASTTAPSPTMTRRSASIRTMQTPSTTVASPTATRASPTARSPTLTSLSRFRRPTPPGRTERMRLAGNPQRVKNAMPGWRSVTRDRPCASRRTRPISRIRWQRP